MPGTSEYVTELLNSTLVAVNTVIPGEIQRTTAPSLIGDSFLQSELGVLVGLTGQVSGRLILDAHSKTFSNVAETMYGMALEGQMLESFVGEIGNMVAGNTVSELSTRGITCNISPPTVMVGTTKLTGFHKGILVPVNLGGLGAMNVVLIMEG